MATEDLVRIVKAEIVRLNIVLELLETGLPVPTAAQKKPTKRTKHKKVVKPAAKKAAPKKVTVQKPAAGPAKRGFTAAGLKRLSEAAKKRWAAAKKAGITTGKLPTAKAAPFK